MILNRIRSSFDFKSLSRPTNVLRNQIQKLHDIKNILNSYDSLINKEVEVSGWIRFIRLQKENSFIHINDGSDCNNLQLIAIKKELIEQNKYDVFSEATKYLHFGTAVQVKGMLVKSTHKQQAVELRISDIQVLGKCDPDKYPFQLKHQVNLEALRQHLHLRSNINTYASILKYRSALTMLLHNYFQSQNFTHIHTPIITKSNCEGSCETFELVTKREKNNFFTGPAYLTSSAQLHLEAMVNSLGKVYTISPTFRAERSLTRHHLSEFYMIEAEQMNIVKLDDLLGVVENLVKNICINGYQSSINNDLNLLAGAFKGSFSLNEHIEQVKAIGDKQFIRIKYEDAIKILNENASLPKLSFGEDLSKAHEMALIQHYHSVPVFVTHYPRSLKPFYMRVCDENPNVVENFDLLVENVGELVGGSAREYRYNVLLESIKAHGLNVENYQLYLETKEFGGMKMGGFGIGLDRFMQFLLNIDNIRDTCAFPRHWEYCKM